MYITYDPEAGALLVVLRDDRPPADGMREGDVTLDLDEAGQVVSLEVLHDSTYVIGGELVELAYRATPTAAMMECRSNSR
jgi:uncharacterized protein YuzE